MIVEKIQKIISHSFFPYFLLYSLSYILLGQVITCLGPMFPYLAAHEKRLQTEYSFLFVSRASGFICGSLLLRAIGQRLTLHQFIALGIGLMSLFSVLFGQTSNLYLKGLCIFLSSIGSSFQDVTINLAALDCFKGDNLSSWLQTIHGGFGIGGLLGPFIVYLFQLHTLTFLGFLSFFSAILYFKLETPQKIMNVDKIKQQDSKITQLPTTSIYLISAGFLFAVGQEVSYGGWISSYAVLNGFSTKEHATFYSSLYWISITFFRFALAALSGPPSAKIRNLGMIGFFTTFLAQFLIFHVDSQFGLITTSLLYGLTNSVLFPLLLTIPQQFGYKLTIKQSTVFIVWASLGQGCLAVLVGKLMEWFSYDWLLYSMCLINAAMIGVIVGNSRVMVREGVKGKERGNLEGLLVQGKGKLDTPERDGVQMKKIDHKFDNF